MKTNCNLFLCGLIGVGLSTSPFTSNAGEYDKHGLKRLVSRVIYKEKGEYKGSIPKMQSVSKSGFKIASLCKIASTTMKAIYKKNLNEIAEYYSLVFGDVYTMALNTEVSAGGGAALLYKQGHSDKTAQWAGQRMSLIRSTMILLHGDLDMVGPVGMPAFGKSPGSGALTSAEFTKFMVMVKQKAGSSDALTTNMAAALACSPAKLNSLVDKSSFLIKDKISGLLSDPAGGNSKIPEEMKTTPKTFNPQNVGDLYLALGVVALYVQNPGALSKEGIALPPNVNSSLKVMKAKFIADSKEISTKIAATKKGAAKWDSAPLGPAEIK